MPTAPAVAAPVSIMRVLDSRRFGTLIPVDGGGPPPVDGGGPPGGRAKLTPVKVRILPPPPVESLRLTASSRPGLVSSYLYLLFTNCREGVLAATRLLPFAGP